MKIQKLKKILLNENIQLLGIYALSFAIPFIFKQPQIIIGSIINGLLILSISRYGLKKIIPILFLPSIATLLNGALFGTFTIYLVYLIPFIILSNLIYVLSFKLIKQRTLNVLTASLLKSCFLFSCVYILFHVIHIPEVFLTSMGIIQLATAITGGLISSILISKRKN